MTLATGNPIVCLVCIMAMLQPALAQGPRLADPAVYGALPTVSQAEISPDGKTVAQIQSANGGRAVAFYDLAGQKTPIGVNLGDVDARGLRWVGPNHVLLLISASHTLGTGGGIQTREVWRWLSINRTTGEYAYLLNGDSRVNFWNFSGDFASLLPDDPNHVLMAHYSRNGEYSLYTVNLDTGKRQLAERGHRKRDSDFAGTVDWVLDADGDAVIRIEYDEDKEERRFYKRSPDGASWILASAVSEKKEDEIKIIAIALAGADHLIHAAMTVDGFRGLYVFDIDKGEVVKTEFASTQYDIASVLRDSWTASVVGVSYVGDLARTHFLESELAALYRNLQKAIPNGSPQITSWSRDFSKFMVRVVYTDHPDQFFIYDDEKKSLAMFSAAYEALDGRTEARKEKYDFVASDGLKIPGYLTVPKAATKQSMPLIVLPHGGPFARDDQAFDWWPFFYAARNYLVYQPNFRGSEGYGEAYRQAGFGEWGRKMQDDITEGVQSLIADGIVDPDRICIAGASYGGYAALAGATLTPELYACAVSVSGISNVPLLLSDASGDDPENEYWKERVGSRFDKDAMKDISPINEISAATPPILLIHSEHDIVVPVGQSRLMRNALRQKGVEHDFVVMDGEDHWLSTSAARTEMLARSIEFIDRHIGNAN